MKRNGFTLIELLAVIAILAILIIMAVPAVLKTFNKSRKSTFNNELNTIIKAARYQYVLDGEPTTYDNNSNPLRVSNKSDFDYCITVNADGEVIDFKATNGSYKYESNGIVEEASSSDIEDAESGYTLTCSGGSSSITYVNRQNEGSITVGDEVAIDTEHFYVISTNSSDTALFAKYNLLVGNSIISGTKCDDYHVECWDEYQITSLSSSSGYGLQSADALGYTTGGSPAVGVVPFSATSYWVDSGLKSEYANSANVAGKTSSYATPYPYVYDSSKSSAALVLNENNNYDDINFYEPSDDGYHKYDIDDNGYTIAYYVEQYVNRLGINGTGRLLTNEEAQSLASSNSSILYNGQRYWLGSASSSYNVRFVYNSNISANGRSNINSTGVRPVIVISTSLMPN